MAYTATYESADLDDIAIDIAGTFLAGLAEQAGVIVGLMILGIIIVLVIDLMTGMFGIINFFRKKAK